jgi:branched-chain amino acid transport system substrate-binding protein
MVAPNGAAVVETMKHTVFADRVYGRTTIRPDGRALHPVYLFQTKTEAESHGPWDYLKLVSTLSAEEAYRPLAEGHSPLVH